MKVLADMFKELPDGSEFVENWHLSRHGWEKVELLDQLSVHDEEWAIEKGNLSAIGMYSLGELVEISEIERKEN